MLFIEVTPGGYPYEISWSLSCADGTALSAGAPPYSGPVDIVPGSVCTVLLLDSFGDGWNAAEWTAGSESFYLDGGSEASFTFALPYLPPYTPPLHPPSPSEPPFPPSSPR